MSNVGQLTAHPYRTIWISDVHLGFRGCRADLLLEFLQSNDCRYLYLVGDIIDLWSLKKRLFWPQSHNDVIRALLGKAQRGTEIIYIPGNHDEALRDHLGTALGNVTIDRNVIHTTASGKRLLVLHGDEFDAVVTCSKMLALIGSKLYDWLLYANNVVNYLRRKLGFPYWSLAAYLKHRVKNAVQYISNFEAAVAHEAKKRGVDGIVCGHIHRAEITMIQGLLYCNCGDWVESCTALAERYDGQIELLRWCDVQRLAEPLKAVA